MKKALIAVDIQNDFVEGGALGCEGGKDVSARVRELIEESKKKGTYALYISTQDWHRGGGCTNGGHIAEKPDYTDSWPAHCIAETEGADFCEPLEVKDFDYRILKGFETPSYSGFSDNAYEAGDKNLSLMEILKEEKITEVDIPGIAFDYCVAQTAKDAVEQGLNVRILKTLTATINKENENTIAEELKKLGVEIVE